ncbi:hypothetical protein STANM309S_00684 [Streptomyces tanashiensis]
MDKSSQLRHHTVRVLAEPRRSGAVGGRGGVEPDRVGDLTGTGRGLRDAGGEPQPVGEVEGGREVVDRPAGHAGRGELLEPAVGGTGAERSGEGLDQLLPVGDPGRVRGEAGVPGELRPAEPLAQGRELPVVAHGEDQRPVPCLEHLVRRDARVAVAHRARHDPGAEVRGGLVGERGEEGGEQGDLHPLALARALPVPQGGEHAEARVEAGDDVDQGDPRLRALPVRFARHAHEAAHGLDEQVVAGQPGALGGAEAGHRAVDESGVAGPYVLVSEAELLHRAGAEVLDEDVRAVHDRAGRGQVLGVGEVERHGALVPVHAEEVRGLAGGERRSPRARVVPRARSFDLDHVRAQVGEEHRHVRPGEHPAEVGDDDPGQGAAGRRRFWCARLICVHAAFLASAGIPEIGSRRLEIGSNRTVRLACRLFNTGSNIRSAATLRLAELPQSPGGRP